MQIVQAAPRSVRAVRPRRRRRRRHQREVAPPPHVFSDTKVSGTDEAPPTGRSSQGRREEGPRPLDSLPKSLPALLRAPCASERRPRASATTGPMCPGAREDRRGACRSSTSRSRATTRCARKKLFSATCSSRSRAWRESGIRDIGAAGGTLDRFTTRVQSAEALARAEGTTLPELDDAARDVLWERGEARPRATRVCSR